MLQLLYNLVFSLYLLRTNVYRHLCLACLSFYVKHFHNVPADPLGPSPLRAEAGCGSGPAWWGVPSSPTLPLPASGKTLQQRRADPPTTGHYYSRQN